MADPKYMKAVEFDKLPAKFKKQHGDADALRKAGWWVQPKYDGCYGMAVFHQAGPGQMLSRGGQDCSVSCAHILRELDGILPEECVILGEVWHPDRAQPKISGSFMAQRPSDLQFRVHDILPLGLETSTPYRERFHTLGEVLPEDIDGGFHVHRALCYPSHFCQVDVRTYAQQLVARGGFDGAILRDPDAGYTIGNVKRGEIVKVKPTMSLDLRVEGGTNEVGEKTGRNVITLCVDYRGQRSWVGSGVPHDGHAEDYFGKIIEVECMGLTEDGKLREPRFKCMRPDKEEPDT
jgi:ATP-dependent DNA ligase